MKQITWLLATHIMLIAGWLTLLQDPFCFPMSRLLPGFTAPHLIASLVVLFAGLTAQTWVVYRLGLDIAAAVAAQPLVAGLALLISQIEVRQRTGASQANRDKRLPGTRWFSQLPLMALSASLVVVVPYFLLFRHPYLLESFFAGEMSVVAIALFVVGAAVIAGAVPFVPLTNPAFNEAGVLPGLSFKDLRVRQAQQRRRPTLRFARRSSIESKTNWQWRLQAARAPNPSGLWTLVGVILTLAFVILVIPAFIVPARVEGLPPGAAFCLVVLVGAILSSHDLDKWWHRRRTLKSELLFPWTRRELTLAYFAAYAYDIAVSTAVILLGLLAADYSSDWPTPAPFYAVIPAAAIALAMVWWAICVCVLPIRYSVLVIVGFLAGAALFGGLFATPLLVLGKHAYRDHMAAAIGLVALAAVPLAVGLGLVAYRHWMRAEWSLIQS